MRKFLLGAVALLALGMTAPASAADLAPSPYTKAPPVMMPAIYDWSGAYLGLNGGWGSSHKCWDATSVVGVFLGTEGCHDATGGVAGGQFGYRWQNNAAWVFGLEAQGDWANLKGTNQSLLAPVFTNRSRIDAFGLFTGQVGYSWNNALLYVKGGAAVAADRFDVATTLGNTVVAVASGNNRWGGTVGAGVEFGFAPNWSAGVEYDHMFMGTQTATFVSSGTFGVIPAGAYFSSDRIRQDVDLVTVRVNYRWGGPVIAKY
jgi:outer membrane immunogenic protein